jgi:hypothetical protein
MSDTNKLSYATFKGTLAALRAYYREYADTSVKLWRFPSGDTTSYCVIIDPDDIADFEANLKPNATAVESKDDAVAKEKFISGGRLEVLTRPYTNPGRNYDVKGFLLIAELNQESILDITFDTDREVQGAKVMVTNPTLGDYVEFSVLGPFGQGGALVEILKWATTIYAKPNGAIDEYKSEDAKTIPVGITLRLTYHSIGTSGTKPAVYLDMVMWK